MVDNVTGGSGNIDHQHDQTKCPFCMQPLPVKDEPDDDGWATVLNALEQAGGLVAAIAVVVRAMRDNTNEGL